MRLKVAAVVEPDAARAKPIVQGLKRAGLTVKAIAAPDELKHQQVVVLGPSLSSPSKVAREVKRRLPDALVMAAQTRGFRAGWADAVLPLPVSPNDLKLRLVELAEARVLPRLPVQRPGEGMLDPTTNFYTFSHFKEVLFVEVKRARRYGFPLAAAFIAFDPIEGRMDGDLQTQLMSGLALAIRRSLRDTDYPVQYSADRVLLLMPHTDLAGVLIVAKRICERVAKATLQSGDEVLHPTISAGVAAGAPGREFTFTDLVRQGQEGLALAMERGGNRVELSDAADGAHPHPSGSRDAPNTPRGALD